MNDEKYKSYEVSHSPQEVVDLLNSIESSPVTSVQRKNLGESNAVYFVDTDTEPQVLRVSPHTKGHNQFAEEAWAYGKCRDVGMPVPEVFAYTTTPTEQFGEPYMLATRLPGVHPSEMALTEEEQVQILRQMGHYMSLMHRIHLKGFGELHQEGTVFAGEFDTLYEFIINNLDHGWWVEGAKENNLLSENIFTRVKELFEENKELFNLSEASLVHNDFTMGNILIDPETKGVTGVIDMENAKALDPIFEFRRLYRQSGENLEALRPLIEGYDDQSLFDKNFEKKLLMYELLEVMSHHTYYFNRGKPEKLEDMKRKLPELIQRISSYDSSSVDQPVNEV